MIREKILVCGTVKNGARYILSAYRNLKKLEKYFDIEILIYENDSTDNTVELIQSRDIKLISEHIKNKVTRTVAIAHARNSLARKIADKYSCYDYVLMVDFDGPASSLVIDGVSDAIDTYRDVDWAGLFAISKPYYDIWALRCDNDQFGRVDYDCWHESRFKGRDVNEVVTANQIIIETTDLIPVSSAFNGAAIYKVNYIQPTYCGWNEAYGEQCEHVSFNKSITDQGGKLYICPQLIVDTESEHIRKK